MRVLMALVAVCTLAMHARAGAAEGEGTRFVGETKCGAPTCHGAVLPSNDAARRDWRPWKSARTQWNTQTIDHHSRAYRTLETTGGKAIATYMGIQATASEKCLVCHAPAAATAQGSTHDRKEGVTCEHCHGPAEQWLKPHSERDWKEKRAAYFTRGFYDTRNFVLRAKRCASCHVAIDHEIVAAGHPPLQFEMVAYAQIMKHWDDQEQLPRDAFSVDPSLWAVGQVTGLRGALQMVATRAGNDNYQALGKFHNFESANCYQCHHKLVEDALRQATGHEAMVAAVFATLFSDQQGTLAGMWNAVVAGVGAGSEQARSRASALEAWLAPYEERLGRERLDRNATRRVLDRITTSGDSLKRVERFAFSRSPSANTVAIGSVSAPWWWTTGAPEQTVLAIESLCEPAFERKSCVGPGGAIEKDLRALLAAVDRFDYRPEQFASSLAAIHAKLFR